MSVFDKGYKTLCYSILVVSLIWLSPAIALSDEGISRQEAISIVKQKVGGKVLKVKQKGDVYRVKLLTKGGKVRQIRVDAQSGKILKRKKD